MPRFRKRFAQHFLHDTAVQARIVHSFGAQATQNIVEIGPGEGALTRHLLAQLPSLTVVELDRDLVALLRKKFGGERLRSIQADILKTDLTQLCAELGGGKLRLIGNLPYNISTPLLFHLIAHRQVIQDMLFMLQREVALRLLAQPGGRHWGRLSVMSSHTLECRHVLEVPPQAFSPPPKVMSSVVRLIVRDHCQPIAHYPSFERVVKAAFSQRRKTLRNALKLLLSSAQIAACDLDPGERADNVSLQQFIALSEQLTAPPPGQSR